VNPVGPMSNALELARSHLAACASYQAFLGVSGAGAAAAAIAKTYLAALPAPTDGKEYTRAELEETRRPFGIFYTSSAGGYRVRMSARYAQSESGRLFLELETTIPAAYRSTPQADPIDLTVDAEQADRWILNQIGSIVSEFMGLAGQPGYLDAQSVMVMMGPSRERDEDKPTRGCYYWTLLEIGWGTES
jgi:hypothetical protein